MMLTRIVGLVATLAVAAPAAAQPVLKVGVILPFSGQFADPAAQADNGLKLYMQRDPVKARAAN